MKIIEPSKIKWSFNPRLKYSIKYKKQFFKIFLEVPSFFKELSLDDKKVIVEYVYLRLKKKRISKPLHVKFSSFFPDRKRSPKKMSIDHSNFNLDEIVESMNKNYFSNNFQKTTVSWSGRNSRRLLGRYIEEDKSIIVTSYFNDPSIPKYVIEYIVYHEMCHQMYPPFIHDGKRYIHHRVFKENEKKFEYYNQAKNWIKNNIK